ncbi:hypothetical protein BH09DEP1_BH09DEP1_5140 [soil metagenome]
MKQNLLIMILILFSSPLFAMESAQIPPSEENCTICQKPLAKELLRAFSCNHAIHQSCYKNWNTNARASKTDLACTTCRTPIKHFKIEFSPDEIEQRISLLTTASSQIEACVTNPELRPDYHSIARLIKNNALPEGNKNLILNSFIGFLDYIQITPKIAHLIQEREELDEQLSDALESLAAAQTKLKIAQEANSSIALALYENELDRHTKKREKLAKENAKLDKQNAALARRNEQLRAANAFAISLIQSHKRDAGQRLIMQMIATTAAIGYGAYHGSQTITDSSFIQKLIAVQATIAGSALVTAVLLLPDFSVEDAFAEQCDEIDNDSDQQ